MLSITTLHETLIKDNKPELSHHWTHSLCGRYLYQSVSGSDELFLFVVSETWCVDRHSQSSCSGQRLVKIQVTGNQELSRSPVMISLSWLPSVRWEALWGGCWCSARLVVCLQRVKAISWLSVFSGTVKIWAECVWDSSFAQFPFISFPPCPVTPTSPLVSGSSPFVRLTFWQNQWVAVCFITTTNLQHVIFGIETFSLDLFTTSGVQFNTTLHDEPMKEYLNQVVINGEIGLSREKINEITQLDLLHRWQQQTSKNMKVPLWTTEVMKIFFKQSKSVNVKTNSIQFISDWSECWVLELLLLLFSSPQCLYKLQSLFSSHSNLLTSQLDSKRRLQHTLTTCWGPSALSSLL